MKKNYFTIYSNCVLVKGHTKSTLNDLHIGVIQAIPNDLYKIFKCSNSVNIKERLKLVPSINDRTIILEYFEFLSEEGFGFYSEAKPLGFSKAIPTKYVSPFLITNMIIDFSSYNEEILNTIITQADSLNIKSVQVRIYDLEFDLTGLDSLYSIFDKSNILTINIILPFDKFEGCSISQYSKFRFSSIIFYNCQEDEIIEEKGTKIIYSSKRNLQPSCCGVISQSYFTLNIPTYTESLNHNSCLNRKVAVDAKGYIKNCPSMKESFGNIRDTTLLEAINKPGFKKYWNINKEKILVCQECEFRHVCTDCRAYIEDPKDILSKPLKCGYNPYTGEWSEWSTNPLKQKTINYYGIEKINLEKVS